MNRYEHIIIKKLNESEIDEDLLNSNPFKVVFFKIIFDTVWKLCDSLFVYLLIYLEE